MHSLGYVADTTKEAVEDFYPGFARVMVGTARETIRDALPVL